MPKRESPWARPGRPELTRRLPGPAPRCPECGKLMDAATSWEFDGAWPRPGDVSICIYCAAPLQYHGAPLALRRLEGEELILARANPDFRRAEFAVKLAIASRKKQPRRA